VIDPSKTKFVVCDPWAYRTHSSPPAYRDHLTGLGNLYHTGKMPKVREFTSREAPSNVSLSKPWNTVIDSWISSYRKRNANYLLTK